MTHSILGWIIIGIVAGWLTGKIMRGGGFGWLLDMVVGLIGAVIGGAIFRALGYGGPGEHGLIVSIIISPSAPSSSPSSSTLHRPPNHSLALSV